jgi:hypothetical protein
MFAAVVILSLMGIVLFAVLNAIERIMPGHLRDADVPDDVATGTL